MVAKLLITAITVAGGVPIGIIGPVLVAGAATGALGGMLGAGYGLRKLLTQGFRPCSVWQP